MTDEPHWNSRDMHIPLSEFARLFRLTGKEITREWREERLTGLGRKRADGQGYTDVCFAESEARIWVGNPNLPPRVRRKVSEAGGLEALKRWRHDYIARCEIDWMNSAIILPDGTRIENVHVRENRHDG